MDEMKVAELMLFILPIVTFTIEIVCLHAWKNQFCCHAFNLNLVENFCNLILTPDLIAKKKHEKAIYIRTLLFI